MDVGVLGDENWKSSFDSVNVLKRQINAFVDNYNQHPKPFVWTATAESIFAKLERLCKVFDGMRDLGSAYQVDE